MADTTTTNLNLTKPEIGAAEDTWGISLNNDLDAIDAIFSATGTPVSLNIDGGDIASAVTINKSPVITLGGDLTGNVTLTNLASGTLSASLASSISPTFQNLTLSGTDSIKVPAGTTAQRNGSAVNGMFRYNTTTNEFEGYQNNAWGAVGGGTTINNNADNRIITGSGTADTLEAETNLTYDGSTLSVLGDITNTTNTFTNVNINSTRTSGNIGGVKFVTNGTPKGSIFGTVDGDVTFTVGGLFTEPMRMKSDGKVGIGISNPQAQLHIGGTVPTVIIGDADEEDIKLIFDGNAQDYHIGLKDAGDKFIIGKGQTLGTDQIIEISDGLSSKPQVGIGYAGANPMSISYTGTAFAVSEQTGTASVQVDGGNAARMDFGVGGTALLRVYNDASNYTEFKRTTNHPIIFNTNNTEILRILSTELKLASGKKLVGGASNVDFTIQSEHRTEIIGASKGTVIFKDQGTAYALFERPTSTNDFDIQNPISDGDITFVGNDGGSTITALTLDMSEAGAATFNNNVTAFSDARLKDNIKTIENGLDKVEQLRGVTYTRDEKENIGVIAQEVEKILPEIVLTADDEMGTKSVDYSRLTAVLIEAVKDLSARVKKLEGK